MNIRQMIEANRQLHDRMKFQGLDISVENKAGSIRKGTDRDGNDWKTLMKVPYGYIRKTEAADGDHVDCFVGPNKNATHAYVVHIKHPDTGKYDEDKVFLGCQDAYHAKNLFDQHYDKPDRFYLGMTTIPMNDFKEKVLDKSNHGKRIQANIMLEPVPSFRPPTKHGLSRVPTDDPGETDDKFMDVTLRKNADVSQRLGTLARPTTGITTVAPTPVTGTPHDFMR